MMTRQTVLVVSRLQFHRVTTRIRSKVWVSTSPQSSSCWSCCGLGSSSSVCSSSAGNRCLHLRRPAPQSLQPSKLMLGNESRRWKSSSSSFSSFKDTNFQQLRPPQKFGHNNDTITQDFLSLETSWKRIKNRLLDERTLPIGSLQPVHWAEAAGLFKSLHRFSSIHHHHPYTDAAAGADGHDGNNPNEMSQKHEHHHQRGVVRRQCRIVHDSFAILDRLDQEVVAATAAPAASARDRLPIPCNVRMLGSVVGAWRQAVRASAANDESVAAAPYSGDDNYGNHETDHPHTLDPHVLLTPRQVLSKLQHYTATGLFVPNRMIYTSLVFAIGGGGNKNSSNSNSHDPFEAARLAEEIVEGMRARAKYNAHDYRHHPNRDAILNLLHRYAEAAATVTSAVHPTSGNSSRSNDEAMAPKKAQEYLRLLQSWHDLTHRPDMRPDTRMYATVISAWGNHAARFHHQHIRSGGGGGSIAVGGGGASSSNSSSSILSRIQALYSEMNREYPFIISYDMDGNSSNKTNAIHVSAADDDDDDLEEYFEQFEIVNDDEEEENYHEEEDGQSLSAYNAIVHALAQTRQAGAGQMAHDILNQLLQNYQRNPNTTLKPNQNTFSAVISAYGRTSHADEAAAVLQVMEDLYYKTADVSFRPNNACFGALIWAFAKVGDAQRAEAVLIRMANMVSTGQGGSDLELDIDCWNGVLVAWAQSGHEDATERTATVIQWLQEMGKNKNKGGENDGDDFLSVKTYNTLLGCFARSPNPQQGARLAQDLLVWMEQENDKVHDTRQGHRLQPDGNSYLACITAWRNAKDPARAQAVLDMFCDKLQSQREKRDGQHHDVQTTTSMIDRRHFHIAMAAWAESLDPKRGKKARELMDRMIHDFAIQPDVVTFNTLINAWAARSLENAVIATEKAEGLLKIMKEQHRLGDTAAQPDQTTYNSMIAILSRSIAPSVPDRAMELFGEMLELGLAPDRRTYNTLMALFSRHGRPDKVQELFQEMVVGWKGGDESLKPHFKVYTTLLQAWSKAGEPEETAKVLKEMISKCESRELTGKPTSRDFDTVLQAWMRSNRPDAPGHAARGLAQMELLAKSGRFECWPTVYSYSSVISTYVRSRQPNAGEGAMNIFRRLKEVYQRTRCASLRPSASDYAQVMIALSFASSPEASREIEKLLMEVADEDESFWSQRNVGSSYYRVMKEIAKSTLPEKDAIVTSLTELLENRGLTPNTTTNPREATRRIKGGR